MGIKNRIMLLADADATYRFGMRLGQVLSAGSVILLEGDLGSGKTTLVQGIGQGLGITEPIISPTFILISEYLDGRIPLYHLDLYRLQPPEVDSLHLEAYWEGQEFPLGIVAIEWSERLSYRPSSYLGIKLTAIEQSRQASLTCMGAFQPDVLDQLTQ
jgi:tRNA threonylcarbamoyladenosine biosynthesis protein TsaE